MKRYQFRLASVLRVRRIEEERARADLLAANRAVNAAQLHVTRRIAHLDSLPKQSRIDATPSFLANQARLASVASSISLAALARQVAEESAADRRVAWQGSARRVESLERLDDRARSEHALEAQRAADKEVDDLVVSRFRQQRPGPGGEQ